MLNPYCIRRRASWLVVQLLSGGLLGVALLGCPGEKLTLYDGLTHEPPPHWPNSLTEAHRLLSERLQILAADPAVPTAPVELLDLVSWIPETAADTDLSETDWQPIYNLCEQLRRQLKSGVTVPQLTAEFAAAELLAEAMRGWPTPYHRSPNRLMRP